MKKEAGYFTISHAITDSKKFHDLSFEAKALFLWIHKWSNRYGGRNNGWFSRSLSKLSGDLGICANTVKRAKEELKSFGLLEEISGKAKRCSNRYRLIP